MGKASRMKREKHERYDALLTKLPKDFPYRVTSVDKPRSGVKLSEALLEFLEPFTDGMEGEEEWKKVVGIGVIAWNAALLPWDSVLTSLQDFCDSIAHPDPKTLKAVLLDLVDRKLSFFAEDKRMVLRYEVSMTEKGPFLSVVSGEQS